MVGRDLDAALALIVFVGGKREGRWLLLDALVALPADASEEGQGSLVAFLLLLVDHGGLVL